MIFLFLYLTLIAVLFFVKKRNTSSPVFRSGKKVSWLISGLSLYMYYLSADQGQLLTGIIAKHGMSGMWMIWAAWLGTFVVPIVFAPLWQKLDFLTDNQFLLFRYPGSSGRFLHLFRVIYVGGLVVALSLCFHLIGFSRILQVFFDIPYLTAVVLTGSVLAVFSLKNIFERKLKMDVFHAVLFFLSLLMIVTPLIYKMQGWDDFLKFFKLNPEKAKLFPAKENTNEWFSLFVFVGIQWWSSYLFDGGGPEMARFTAVKGKKHAVLTGLLPIFISFVLSFVMMGHIFLLLGRSNHEVNPNLFYVESVFSVVPEFFHGLVVLGFFGMFITTTESLLNWGGSFLTIDAVKGYIFPKINEKQLRMISFGSMLFLSITATCFALAIDSLQSLVKITFSVAAGVAPVYILRWIWFRINAWSQFSAMFSSAVFTLVYPYFHASFPLCNFPMEESRVLVVTILTSAVWVLVTFLTPDDSQAVRLKMMPVLQSRWLFVKRFVMAIALGAFFLAFVAVFWYWVLD